MIAKAFLREPEGKEVQALSTDHIIWQHFATVTCESLANQNIVLLGDAAHTAHFSQGFGTMLAFDDALALRASLEQTGSIHAALAAYTAEQRARTVAFQATATASMRWVEDTLASAERGDAAKVRELIAARWTDNQVTPSPMPRRGCLI